MRVGHVIIDIRPAGGHLIVELITVGLRAPRK
jgi:hypothetical protein